MERRKQSADYWRKLNSYAILLKQKRGHIVPGKLAHIILILLAILSIATATVAITAGNPVAAWFGAPGIVLLLSLFHELGHLLNCAIYRQKINAFYFLMFHISSKGIQFRKDCSLKSYCTFAKGPHDLAIYAGGPIASLLAVCIVGVVLHRASLAILCLYSIISLLHLLSNLIPYRRNDMKRIIEIIRERRCNKL